MSLGLRLKASGFFKLITKLFSIFVLLCLALLTTAPLCISTWMHFLYMSNTCGMPVSGVNPLQWEAIVTGESLLPAVMKPENSGCIRPCQPGSLKGYARNYSSFAGIWIII